MTSRWLLIRTIGETVERFVGVSGRYIDGSRR